MYVSLDYSKLVSSDFKMVCRLPKANYFFTCVTFETFLPERSGKNSAAVTTAQHDPGIRVSEIVIDIQDCDEKHLVYVEGVGSASIIPAEQTHFDFSCFVLYHGCTTAPQGVIHLKRDCSPVSLNLSLVYIAKYVFIKNYSILLRINSISIYLEYIQHRHLILFDYQNRMTIMIGFIYFIFIFKSNLTF